MRRIRILAQRPRVLENHVLIPQRPPHPASRSFASRDFKGASVRMRPRQVAVHCPECNMALSTSLPTCANCGYIAPIPEGLKTDYFSVFGLPSLKNPRPADEDGIEDVRNVFNVDAGELRNRFLQMQKLCHPDRWAQKGADAADAAANQSALLNKAYQTLLSPRKRGEYILTQQGVDILEAENMEEEQELMLQVMEAREELEEAEGDEVQELLEVNRGRLEKATMELENAIAHEDWAEAKRAVIRLRYWESFQRAGKGMDVDH